jgi:hypothetical protein
MASLFGMIMALFLRTSYQCAQNWTLTSIFKHLTFFRVHPTTKKSGVSLLHCTQLCAPQRPSYILDGQYFCNHLQCSSTLKKRTYSCLVKVTLLPQQPLVHCILQCLITGIVVFAQPFYQRSVAHQASYSMGTEFFHVGKQTEAWVSHLTPYKAEV